MRQIALVLIILSEILIAITRGKDINGSGFSFLTTLLVVVIVAFTFSAIFQNFLSKLTLTRNYVISGAIGVVVGFLYYSWVKDHIPAMLNWLKIWGIYILLAVILISAITLFLKPRSQGSSSPAQSES